MLRSSAPATTDEDDIETPAPIPLLDPIIRKEKVEPGQETIVRDFAYSFDDFLFWNFATLPEARSSISASDTSDEHESAGAALTEHTGFQGAPPWLQSSHDGGLSEEDLSSQAHDDELHGRAIALFDFSPEHENEFPLTEGQVIYISSRHGLGWLVAVDMESGDCGLVPEEYVRLLEDEDDTLAESDLDKSFENGPSQQDKISDGLRKDDMHNHNEADHEEWVDEPEEMDISTNMDATEAKKQDSQKPPEELSDAERQAIFDAAEREMRMNDARLRDL